MINNNYIIDKGELLKDKLLEYGFTKKGNNYYYQYKLSNKDLLLKITIGNNNKIDIYDTNFNDLYIMSNSTYSKEVYNEVIKVLDDIVSKCVLDNKILIDNYIKDKYFIDGEHPWDKYPHFETFKKNGKWFLLYMDVKGSVFNLKEDIVRVVNLKLDIKRDNKVIFDGYHMNKKYWVSVLIDKIDINYLYELIDNSYRNVG